MIKNKKLALVFRIAAMLTAAAGLLDLMGAFRGELYIDVIYYYTAQSNILAIVLFGMLIVKTILSLGKGPESACYFPRFAMVCAIDILLTFVVFWTLLVPVLDGILPLWTFDNLAVHAITPLLCLLDYILFSEPRRLKYRDVYYVTIFPLCYVAASSIAGLAGHVYEISPADGAPIRFPYFFFDFDRIGMFSLAYIGGLIVFFLIIGHIFYFLDAKVRKPKVNGNIICLNPDRRIK